MPYRLFHPRRPDPAPLFLDASEFAVEFPGEGDHLELKQGISPQRIQETAVAFSNADGGVLVAGVVLVRRGASNTALLGPDLSMFLARRTFTTFERAPSEVPVSDADPELRRRLCEAFGWPDDDHAVERMVENGFVAVEGQDTVLTIAGALLLLRDPKRMGGRPYIDVRRYAEGEPDPDRVWEIVGPVDGQIELASALVRGELGSVSVIVGSRRIELPRLPERALREAIANAVAHRSYENAGTAIRIDIHPSHVTITSPGGLPEPVTIEHIRVQQAARNDRIVGALRRLHLAEDQGKGIDRIEDDMAVRSGTSSMWTAWSQDPSFKGSCARGWSSRSVSAAGPNTASTRRFPYQPGSATPIPSSTRWHGTSQRKLR